MFPLGAYFSYRVNLPYISSGSARHINLFHSKTIFPPRLLTHHVFIAILSMSPPRRALIAITSAHASLFEGGGHETGVFISEALHPYNVLKAAGFEVDVASEKGTWTEDWLSLQPGFLSDEERNQYDDKSSDFRSEIDRNVKAKDLLEKEVRRRLSYPLSDGG
jgi:hypothetical protein